MQMNVIEGLARLRQGETLNCATPDGAKFQIQPRIGEWLLWVRVRPIRHGCLNWYSRLSDTELLAWLSNVTIETTQNGDTNESGRT